MKKKLHSRRGRWMQQYQQAPHRPPVEPARPEGDYVIEPPPVRCPKCESSSTHIYRTMKTIPIIRYRFCKKCGQRFQSVQYIT